MKKLLSDITLKRRFISAGMMMILMVFMALPMSIFAQDPAGTKTGTINDIDTTMAKVVDSVSKSKDTTVAQASNSINKLASAITTIGNADGHNKIAINIMWTLITGFLVMFMQAGFAMVETGFTQKKNVAHTMTMNFMIYALGMLGFWICGFAFMFGGALNPASLGGGVASASHEITIHLFGKDFGLIGAAGYFLGSNVYDVGRCKPY